MLLHYILGIFSGLQVILAGLKSCSDVSSSKLELCAENGEHYAHPFPVFLRTYIYMKEIVDIDQDKNSISLRLGLWTFWNVAGVSLSNDSVT